MIPDPLRNKLLADESPHLGLFVALLGKMVPDDLSQKLQVLANCFATEISRGEELLEQRHTLGLNFGSEVSSVTKRRLEYAFRVFCNVFGYCATFGADASREAEHPRICYGAETTRNTDVHIPALYTPREPSVPVQAPTWMNLGPSQVYARLGLTSIPCFHPPYAKQIVDWLGEIFEWISCADEQAVTERDDAGRIPFLAGIHGRFHLDTTIPYASVAMYELNRSIRAVVGDSWPERPTKPWVGIENTVFAASHDLDYLPTGSFDNFKRLVKNLAIAALHFRDPALTVSIAAALLAGVAAGKSPLDCVDEMCARELAAGIRSTSHVIPYRAHPRDANYDLEDPRVARALGRIANDGMEVALHGSYTSLSSGGLKREAERLAAAGYHAAGVRQHWLRYAGNNLFKEVERLGLSYDSTVGFSDRVGFRSGASFAYPPYDFDQERPYAFIEIPLALMDVAVHQHVRQTGGDAAVLCNRVLDMVEAFGWGGVTILWHNTVFRGAQIPLEIGKLYWDLKRPTHRWVTAKELAEIAATRFKGVSSVSHAANGSS